MMGTPRVTIGDSGTNMHCCQTSRLGDNNETVGVHAIELSTKGIARQGALDSLRHAKLHVVRSRRRIEHKRRPVLR